MKSKKRKNPLVAYTLYPSEYKILQNKAEHLGVSIAQVARAYLRYVLNCSMEFTAGVAPRGRMEAQK